MALEPFPKRTKVADPPMRRADAPSIPKKDVQPTSQKGPGNVKLCSLCKKWQVMPPITRCKPCNSLYNRVLNAKKTMGRCSIEVWDNVYKEKKVEFIMSAQDLTASNLRVRLRQFVGEDIESMQSISHSPGLADKYKHKPAQLSRPNRKCYLYEGMQDQSNFKAEETRREKPKMTS